MKLQKRMKNLDVTSPNVCKLLSERLNSFCKYLDDEYDINSGGCCWVAYCIAQMLEKSNIHYFLELCSYEDISEIEHLDELYDSTTHYFISIQDSDGEVYYINKAGFDSVHTIYDINQDDLLEHYKKHDWCCAYEHCKNKTIQALLKTFYIDLFYDISKGCRVR